MRKSSLVTRTESSCWQATRRPCCRRWRSEDSRPYVLAFRSRTSPLTTWRWSRHSRNTSWTRLGVIKKRLRWNAKNCAPVATFMSPSSRPSTRKVSRRASSSACPELRSIWDRAAVLTDVGAVAQSKHETQTREMNWLPQGDTQLRWRGSKDMIINVIVLMFTVGSSAHVRHGM